MNGLGAAQQPDKVEIDGSAYALVQSFNEVSKEDAGLFSIFLDTQIELLDPRILVTLGRFSFSKFFPASQLSNSRGKIHPWDTRLVYPIYHPAAALHNPKLRPIIENDFRRLSIILKELSLPIQDPSERLLSKAQQLALFDTFQ